MPRCALLLMVLVAMVGCDPGEASSMGEPKAPPASQPAQSQPLLSVPFLPSLSPHRMAVWGDLVLVADPEGAASDGRRPRVHLVSISRSLTLTSFELPDGANPGAVEINPTSGVGYVVARGSGGIYPMDLATYRLGQFIHTCAAPVDLASVGGSMLVACLGGELVTVTGPNVSTRDLGRNLTSVAVDSSGHVFVATSTAELINADTLSSVTPVSVNLQDKRQRRLTPDTARRLVAGAPGSVAMLFQQSIVGELQAEAGMLAPPDGSTGGTTGGGYGGANSDCPVPAARAALGISLNGATTGGGHASTATLAVDLAVSADGKRLAVADAAGGVVEITPATVVNSTTMSGCFSEAPLTVGTGADGSTFRVGVTVDSPMAVAFASDGRLVVLSGAPSLQVQVFAATTLAKLSTVAIRSRQVPIGFTLFHSRPNPLTTTQNIPTFFRGPSLACASCHPDGLSNGAVTTLAGVKHKVMPLAGRLATATRVHWDAKPFKEAVVDETWTRQMGGIALSLNDQASLQAYVGQLELPHRLALDAASIARGEAAFTKGQCASCHTPSNAFTNDGAANVGQGLHKVPSLRGLAFSAPYMSNGCASTVEERFTNVACGGGDLHGKPSMLSAVERSDLAVYLRSL